MERPSPADDGTPRVLDPDAALPAVPTYPAPWQLRASAYVIVTRLPEALLDRAAFVPERLVPKRRGRIGCLLLVDYQIADCGPYRELLLAPASFAFPSGTHPSITRIYVSSYDSVVNGRRNWGIPKDRADFEVQRDEATSTERIRVSRDGHTFAELELRAHGPSLPVRSWLIPKGMRTLIQLWQGKSYRFSLSARGSTRLASVVSWKFDPAYFPDLAQGTVLAAAYLPSFDMTFPVAEISELLRES